MLIGYNRADVNSEHREVGTSLVPVPTSHTTAHRLVQAVPSFIGATLREAAPLYRSFQLFIRKLALPLSHSR